MERWVGLGVIAHDLRVIAQALAAEHRIGRGGVEVARPLDVTTVQDAYIRSKQSRKMSILAIPERFAKQSSTTTSLGFNRA